MIVETRAGAGGALGAQAVIAAQDGHSFLFATGSVAIQPALQPDIGYDPLRDLVPVSLVSESPMGFAVRPESPLRDLAGLIAAARAAPGRLTIGSSGTGTTTHMVSALFGLRAGVVADPCALPRRRADDRRFLAGDIDLMSAELSTRCRTCGRAGRGPGADRRPPQPGAGRGAGAGGDGAGHRPADLVRPARHRAAPRPRRSPGWPRRWRRCATGCPGRAHGGEWRRPCCWPGPEALAARLAREVPLWRQVVQQAGITAD